MATELAMSAEDLCKAIGEIRRLLMLVPHR
jgi:hypothetical protein